MISYKEALDKILAQAKPLPEKQIGLAKLLGYVLSRPLIARFPLPRFDSSSVDGYGVLLTDVVEAREHYPVRLRLLGEIRAGSPEEIQLNSGSTIKILTGGRVPDSVDAVVMREFCHEENGDLLVSCSAGSGENIRRMGAEFAQGSEILPAGIRITPPVVGLIANLGYDSYFVHDKPKITIVTTGDELIAPGKELSPGQIYDSNSYALSAALTALGIAEPAIYRAKDTKQETEEAFTNAMEQTDIVISSGGVSVGDHDYVKTVLETMGVETVFWRIAVKPGKPVYFGIVQDQKNERVKLIFGLPGNPVSALVTYHQFVKPAILQCMGITADSSSTDCAALTRDLRKKPGRLDFVRGKVRPSAEGKLQAEPTRGQDSHMLGGLAQANALIHFDAESERLDAGVNIAFQYLDWHN